MMDRPVGYRENSCVVLYEQKFLPMAWTESAVIRSFTYAGRRSVGFINEAVFA